MKKQLLLPLFSFFFIVVFVSEHKAQDYSYKTLKDSLFYGPRNKSLKEVLLSLNAAIVNTADVKKASLYKIAKLKPLIELEQLTNALKLTDDLLLVVAKDLEITVRIRRSLIYEFLGNFDKSVAELSKAEAIFNENNIIRNEEYGELLYRYSSIYRVNGKPKEALDYINKAILFAEKSKYNDVLAVSYMVKSFIVGKNNTKVYKDLLQKALVNARASKNKFHIRSIYSNLGRFYHKMGEPKIALKYTDSILIYDKLLHKSISGTNSYLLKSKCYLDLNMPKIALENYKIYHKRTTEERISKENLIINELEHNFYIEKEVIKRDQVFKDNKKIKEENSNLLWFITSLTFLAFSLILATIYISKRNKTIKETRAQIAIKNSLLTKGLKEKEVLLKELHHRVKNNLALIISLVDFQALGIKNTQEKQNYIALKQRIEAIAVLHEQMLINSDKELNDSYNINTYLNTISKSLIGLSPKKVYFLNQIENIYVPIDVAVPIGILINELISNSLKHHSDNSDIYITLKITEIDEFLHINYFDNGKEFIVKPSHKKSLGLFIIENMVLQLKGTLKRDNTNYTIKVRKLKRT